MAGNVDRHELRIVLDHAGRPQAGSATTVMRSGSWRTTPVEFGPFDTLADAVAALEERLDIQQSLW